VNEQKKGLNTSGYKRIAIIYLFTLVQTVTFFAAAGRIDLPRAWLLYGLNIGLTIFNTIIGAKLYPELMNARGDLKKKNTKSWDIVFMIVYTAMMFVSPVIAGLDVGRFRWSETSIYWIPLGIVFFFISAVFVDWAMSANTHFETSVRIQKDRKHAVVSTGPYHVIRHPGYVGMILLYLSFPLIIGSLFVWIPTIVIVVSIFVRTALEDKTLRNELEGYTNYSNKVRYRLIPGVW